MFDARDELTWLGLFYLFMALLIIGGAFKWAGIF